MSEPRESRSIGTILRAFIVENFLQGENSEDFLDSSPLISGGVMDSIGIIKMVGFLENQFNIQIRAHETGIENFGSISALEKFVERKRRGEK